MLAIPVFNDISSYNYQLLQISEIYVIIWCIYNPSIELGKNGSNS